MQFFCETAGPFLSGPMDSYFWTHLTMQFGQFEPAVRHSLISISSLYEQLQYNSQPLPLLADNRFALSHYNSAIRELKTLDNEPLVLLVCILFICIEFLQGHREAAIEHCRHGITILKNVEDAFPWTREYLSPIFRRLNMLPLFFGVMPGTFPRVTELDTSSPTSFSSLVDAQFYLDDIMNRAIHLVRYGDMYTLGGRSPERDPVKPEFLEEQVDINKALDAWQARFKELESKSPTPPNPTKEHCNIIVRYNISRIWVNTTFQNTEMVFDKHIDAFKLMVDEANKLETIVGSSAANSPVRPKFIFENGFTAMFYFVVMKCRCLATRVRALGLVKSLGVARENMWHTSGMWITGRRLIELEHGIKLDANGQPCDVAVDWTTLPPDVARIRSTSTAPNITTQTGENGEVVAGRMVGFFMRSPEGSVYLHSEFVPEIASPGSITVDDSSRIQLTSGHLETTDKQMLDNTQG